MQFTVSQDIIARPLQLVCSIVERRSTLPILSNILLRCRDQQLTMTSTDMELEMIATLPVAVEKEGETTVLGTQTIGYRSRLTRKRHYQLSG